MRTDDRLAFRLLLRQWRAGALRLLLLATITGSMLATLVAVFGDRLERALVQRGAEQVGADLVLTGNRPPTDATLAAMTRDDTRITRAVDFSTMLAARGETLLVSARAVDAAFPARGRLRVRIDDRVTDHLPPAAGEILIEARVAEQLRVAPGDVVEVGSLPLRVSGLLEEAPEPGGGFGALAPRVLFSLDDLEATGVVQPGSRVRWRTLLAGSADTVADVRDALEDKLAPHEEIVDAATGSRRTATSLSRAVHFFALAAGLGLLICGAAIALAASRHARSRYDTVALLRTFGMGHGAIRRMLVIELLALAVISGLCGSLLGHAAQEMLARLLGTLIPFALPPANPRVALSGLATALIALPLFALPALLRLRDIPPLRVLRADIEPPPARTWLASGFGAGTAALVAILLSREPWLAAALLAGTASLLLLMLPLIAGMIRLLRHPRLRLPAGLWLAAGRLAASPWRSAIQMLAFTLILATLALAAVVRDDLFSNWRQQQPADAPNLFALNLLPHEHEAFLATLAARHIAPPVIHPVTPGRLVRVNDEPLATRMEQRPETRGALDRDLVLTQGQPEPATVTLGNAHLAAGEVSVEEELAKQLGLSPGDRLVFVVEGREFTVTVRSFRRVEWDSFRPNFFMILAPGTLVDAPYTGLGSFHADDVASVVRELRSRFPAITLIEVGPLIARAQEYLGLVARGVEFVALLLLCAAMLLLATTVLVSLDERLAEAALLRVFGARRRWLRRQLMTEFALLGALAGTLALLATEAARLALYRSWLDLPWLPLPSLWIGLPLGGAMLLALAGWLATRGSLATDAGEILRRPG